MTLSTNEPVHTWILLRGLSREAGHWAGFPILLADAGGEEGDWVFWVPLGDSGDRFGEV